MERKDRKDREMGKEGKTMSELLNDLMHTLSAFPAPKPIHFRVHPSRYDQLRDYLINNWVFIPTPNAPPVPIFGIEIIQDTFVPASRTERRRRFLTKKQRSRWYVRKYRTVEVPVFGWLFETDKISSIEMKRG